MENLREKIRLKREQIDDVQQELKVRSMAKVKVNNELKSFRIVCRTADGDRRREPSIRRRKRSS